MTISDPLARLFVENTELMIGMFRDEDGEDAARQIIEALQAGLDRQKPPVRRDRLQGDRLRVFHEWRNAARGKKRAILRRECKQLGFSSLQSIERKFYSYLAMYDS